MASPSILLSGAHGVLNHPFALLILKSTVIRTKKSAHGSCQSPFLLQTRSQVLVFMGNLGLSQKTLISPPDDDLEIAHLLGESPHRTF